MSEIQTYIDTWQFIRARTLATLAEIEKLSDPMAVMAWRPSPGRAHVAWQMMHIAITEELFATARIQGTQPGFNGMIERFRGGSNPDDNIPSLDAIKATLLESRKHLIETASSLSEQDLERIPEAFVQRGWTIRTAFQVIAWHEAHHQGQAHITFNLYKHQCINIRT